MLNSRVKTSNSLMQTNLLSNTNRHTSGRDQNLGILESSNFNSADKEDYNIHKGPKSRHLICSKTFFLMMILRTLQNNIELYLYFIRRNVTDSKPAFYAGDTANIQAK